MNMHFGENLTSMHFCVNGKERQTESTLIHESWVRTKAIWGVMQSMHAIRF